MSIAERLVQIREAYGYSRKMLSDELNIPYSTITKYENGQRIPDHNYIVKIAQKFDVSTDYILGVNATRPKPEFTEKARSIAKQYDTLDDYGRQAVDAVMAVELSRCEEEEEPENVIYLPISRQPASAGKGVPLGPEAFDVIKVRDTEKTRRAAFALRVSGDSMEPIYFDGDIVLVSQENPEPDDIAVVSYQGEGYIKRVEMGKLISENKKYAPIPINDDVWIHGRVIGRLPDQDIVE